MLILSAVSLSASAEESWWIGRDRNATGNQIRIGHRTAGRWVTETFPPGDRFEGNYAPALGISPSGELWVVWAARGEEIPTKIYYSRKLDGTWSDPRRLTADDRLWEMSPAIAFDQEGYPLVAWAGDEDDCSEIYCSRWNGNNFSSMVKVSSPDTSPSLLPALAGIGRGQFILVWQGWQEGHFRIYRSFSDGDKWSQEETVSGEVESDQGRPFVQALGAGRWKCYWQEGDEFFSAQGSRSSWSAPSPSRSSEGMTLPDVALLSPNGWLLRRDTGGNVLTRRASSLGNPSLAREAATDGGGTRSLGNRVYIGYGDSITYGTTPPGFSYCYIPLLENDLEAADFAEYTIYNNGYPGCDTEQLLWGPGYAIRPCPGIAYVISDQHTDASHILIMGGTNDYDEGFSYSTSKAYLRAMINQSRILDCEPVLATIIPGCSTTGLYVWTENLSRDYIVPLAEEENCLLANPFEFYKAYGEWSWCDDLLVADGVHPVWPEGSQVIADAWFEALYAPSTTPSPPPSPTPTPIYLIIDSGDYDGDHTSDIAVFRPSSGLWAVRGLSHCYFGSSSDIPASGDYDNDGTTEAAVFRKSTGLWAVRDLTRIYFGDESDIPVPGDYDGDGFCDIAIFRKANGLWAVRGLSRCYYGGGEDVPVPAYFEGDRVKNIAVFRPSSGLWACRGLTQFYYGSSNDRPAPADYDGDGSDDISLFRGSTGLWAVRAITRFYYGNSSDLPAAAPYDGGSSLGAVFRSSSGLWALRGLSRLYFGGGGDIPASGRIPRPFIPSPSPSPTLSPSPSPSLTPTPTPTPSPSPTPTPTVTP